MKGAFYFIIFVVVLLCIGFGGWYFFLQQSDQNTSPTAAGNTTSGGFTLPSSGSTGTIGGGTTQTGGGGTSGGGGASGSATGNSMDGKMRIGTVVVNDFREKIEPVKSELGGPTYYLEDLFPEEEHPYSIAYFPDDEAFLIALNENPIGAARKQAEDVLRTELGVDDASLCKLKYQVFTPRSISQEFAGKDLRFSFCPDAVSLPEL